MRVLLIGSTGLAGRACSAELSASGCTLMLAGRDAAKLERLKNDLAGPHHEICVWDLAAQAEGACEAIGKFAPDAVVWAARPSYDLVRFSEIAAPMKSADVTIRAVHAVASAVIPAQRAKKFGRWVFLGSLVSRIGGPGQSEYMLEKNALLSVSRTLALEEGRFGITSNAILCGWISSDRATPFDAEKLASMGVTGRGVSPSEIAYTVLFLLNEKAASITGVELPVCGGADLGWFLGRKEWYSDQ